MGIVHSGSERYFSMVIFHKRLAEGLTSLGYCIVSFLELLWPEIALGGSFGG